MLYISVNTNQSVTKQSFPLTLLSYVPPLYRKAPSPLCRHQTQHMNQLPSVPFLQGNASPATYYNPTDNCINCHVIIQHKYASVACITFLLKKNISVAMHYVHTEKCISCHVVHPYREMHCTAMCNKSIKICIHCQVAHTQTHAYRHQLLSYTPTNLVISC